MNQITLQFWTLTWALLLVLSMLLPGAHVLASDTGFVNVKSQGHDAGRLLVGMDVQEYNSATDSATHYEIRFTGQVIDLLADEPIPYAHIALFESGGEELLGGTTSDLDGYFSLVYRGGGMAVDLRISSVAHETLRMSISTMGEGVDGRGVIDLGSIALNPGIVGTEEVLVTAQQVPGRSAHGVQTYFIHESMQQASGSASELMRQIPGVFVDLHQTITFEGNADVQIMVDGRRRDAVYLRQIPSGNVQKVELQRTPGAQSEAGTVAVIHISTNLREPGTVTGSVMADVPFRSNEVFAFPSYSLNAGFGKWNVHTSYSGEFLYFDIEERAEVTNLQGNLMYGSTQQVAQQNWSHRFNYSVDWNARNRTSVQYYGWIRPYSHEHNGTFSDARGAAGTRTDDDRNLGWFQSVVMDYRFAGRYPGLFSAEANVFRYQGRQHSQFQVEGAGEGVHPAAPFTVPSRPEQSTAELHSKVAVALSSALHTETGAMLRFSRMQDRSGPEFDYDEHLVAGYQMVQLGRENTTMSAGLRGEWYSGGAGSFQLLPSVTLSHRISHRYRAEAGWKTMAAQPRLYQLNTNNRVVSPGTVRAGSGGLQPSVSQSLELSVSGVWSNAFGAVTGFRRVKRDFIGVHVQLHSAALDGVVVEESFRNMGDVVRMGLQVAGSLQAGSRITLNGMGSVYHSQMEPANDVERSSRVGADFSGSMVISAGAGFSVSAQVRYISDVHQMQGESYESTLYFVRLDKQFPGGWQGALVSAVPLSPGFVYNGQRLHTSDGHLNTEGRILTGAVPLWISFSYSFRRGTGRDWKFRSGPDIVTSERKGF